MKKLFSITLCFIVLGSLAGFALKQYWFDFRVRRAENFNIVFISLDTTRADFLGCYGNEKVATPNIDDLARRGVLFENFYSTINTTLAAHSSMFTGFYPRNHGVGRNSMRLSEKNLTLAELLKVKGYSTAAFIGSFALSSVHGFNQGFDYFDEAFIGNAKQYVAKTVSHTTKERSQVEVVIPTDNTGNIMRKAEDVNEVFLRWLDGQKKEPFFAFVHYYDPHFPYYPPKQWYERHVPVFPAGVPMTQKEREPLDSQFQEITKTIGDYDGTHVDNRQFPELISTLLKLYLSEIEYTDFAVGQILDALKQKGLESNTIVVLTADHGENLIDHWEFNSFFRHGFLTTETEIHVPFIISAPGILPANRRVTEISSQIDVMPTLLDLLGLKYPEAIDGMSLLPFLFSDRKPHDRMIFAEASQPHANMRKDLSHLSWVNDRNSASVRWKEYKYTVIPRNSYEAVFRISHDRLEEKDILMTLSVKDPKFLNTLRDSLEAWRSKAAAGNVEPGRHLSEEDREKLESLGYLN